MQLQEAQKTDKQYLNKMPPRVTKPYVCGLLWPHSWGPRHPSPPLNLHHPSAGSFSLSYLLPHVRVYFTWLSSTAIEFGCSVSLSCLTVCAPIDGNLPVSSVLGIFQARILKWVAVPSSKGSSRPRDQTRVSCGCCIGRQILYHGASWEARSVPISR